MKVLELTCEPILYGGQEAFIFNCIENMNPKGIDIDIATLYYCENKKYVDIAEKKGFHIYELHLDFKPGKSRRLIIKPLFSFFKNHEYDIVHIHSGSISALGYSAEIARKSGLKNVFVHSHSTGINNLKHKIIQTFFAGKFLRNATKYIACSKEAGIMKFPKSVWKDLIILNNGIDIKKFAYNREIREHIREKLSLSNDVYLVGQIGRFTFEKNQAYLANISKAIQSINSKVKFLFIGDGELKKAIQNGLEESTNTLFLEAKNDIWNYYNALDLLVLPSLYEGIPLVSIEAQANGLPIIASTGVSEEIEINENVKRIDLANMELWIETISKCNLQRCTKMNRINNSEWDISSVTNQLAKLYKSEVE